MRRPSYCVGQGVAHKLTLMLAQENKNFRVCDVGRAYLGNVRWGRHVEGS